MCVVHLPPINLFPFCSLNREETVRRNKMLLEEKERELEKKEEELRQREMASKTRV